MINPLLLIDTINIYEETVVKSTLAKKAWCEVLVYSDIPALIWCWKTELEKPSCAIEKNLKYKMCVEIAPWTLTCYNKKYIIQIIRNNCDLWKFRVQDIIPNRTIAQWHYSDRIIAYSL